MKTEKDLEHYRKNAEEDYLTTPISVLRYIGEMEKELRIADVINQRELLISFFTWIREDNREDLSIEFLVDYWLDKGNSL